MNATDDIAELHTIEQTMTILAASRSMVYRLRDEGKLAFVKMRGATRITRESIDRLIREMREAEYIPSPPRNRKGRNRK